MSYRYVCQKIYGTYLGLVASLVVLLSHTLKKSCGFDPSQGTFPGHGFNPQWGHVRVTTNVSVTVFLSLSFSLKSMNVSLGKDKKKNLMVSDL